MVGMVEGTAGRAWSACWWRHGGLHGSGQAGVQLVCMAGGQHGWQGWLAHTLVCKVLGRGLHTGLHGVRTYWSAWLWTNRPATGGIWAVHRHAHNGSQGSQAIVIITVGTPSTRSAVAPKKSNEANIPSCFLIKDSLC